MLGRPSPFVTDYLRRRAPIDLTIEYGDSLPAGDWRQKQFSVERGAIVGFEIEEFRRDYAVPLNAPRAPRFRCRHAASRAQRNPRGVCNRGSMIYIVLRVVREICGCARHPRRNLRQPGAIKLYRIHLLLPTDRHYWQEK